MKRIACFLLVALMLTVGGASAGEKDYAAMLEQQKAEGLLHLWDIPFGITIDEFMELAPKVTGLPFEIFYQYEKPYSCVFDNTATGADAPQLLDYALSGVSTNFSSLSISRLLDFWVIVWDVEQIKEKQVLVDMYFDLLAKLMEKFGDYEHAEFSVAVLNGEGKRRLIECQLINEDGAINTKDIVSALNNDEKGVYVEFIWKNATFLFSVSPQTRTIGLIMKDSIMEFRRLNDPVPYSQIATKIN